jgi:hypothetical protein
VILIEMVTVNDLNPVEPCGFWCFDRYKIDGHFSADRLVL